jgi:hypothetical protein
MKKRIKKEKTSDTRLQRSENCFSKHADIFFPALWVHKYTALPERCSQDRHTWLESGWLTLHMRRSRSRPRKIFPDSNPHHIYVNISRFDKRFHQSKDGHKGDLSAWQPAASITRSCRSPGSHPAVNRASLGSTPQSKFLKAAVSRTYQQDDPQCREWRMIDYFMITCFGRRIDLNKLSDKSLLANLFFHFLPV